MNISNKRSFTKTDKKERSQKQKQLSSTEKKSTLYVKEIDFKRQATSTTMKYEKEERQRNPIQENTTTTTEESVLDTNSTTQPSTNGWRKVVQSEDYFNKRKVNE